ncbi:MAG: hypothetical protein GX783_02470 [Clostridiales bacterium]|nr:hypothetical protein [Clostridiales bacterium]
MPRIARQKHEQAIYHVMSRSLSEILLFRENDDKDYFLKLLKRYSDKYGASVYAYCLMNNHFHIHLDPKGFDISKFMHSLNTAYVRYYNTKYDRHGHLFQERFQSKVLSSDQYNLAVSAYIHNNPKDIPEYSGREEIYPYSSYGIYLNKRLDYHNIIEKTFIMEILQINNINNFVSVYHEFVRHQRHIDEDSMETLTINVSTEVENEYISGRGVIIRGVSPDKVISYISKQLGFAQQNIAWKGKRELIPYRAFCAYVLRVLGGMSYREICQHMHSITTTCCSRLCDIGFELLNRGDNVYSEMFDELISQAA